MEPEEDAPPPVEQRLPSTRPIDSRWDRSRSIIFNNAKRNISGDFTWSHSDGIVFAEIPASRRGYATRNLFAPKPSGQQAPPQAKPSRPRDSVIDSHKPLSASDFGGTDLLDSLKREQNAHKETKLELEKDIEEMRRKHAAEVNKVREEKATEVDKLEGQIRDHETEKEMEAFRSAERHRALKKKEDDLQARLSRLETTIAEAWRKAKEAANRDVEQLKQSALEREKQAVADAERYRREAGKAMDRLTKEYFDDLHEHKTKLEQASADEMREIREAGLHRENIERADYEAYHRTWDEVRDSTRKYLQEIMQIYALLFAKAEHWKDIARSFDGEKIDPGFPHTYPKLNERLQSFLHASAQEAENSAHALKDLRSSALNTMDDLFRNAHVSRKLTRYHKFETMTNEYLSASLVGDILNEAPLRARLGALDQEIDQINQRLQRSTDQATKESLQQKLQSDKSQRSVISKLLEFFICLREVEGLEALRHDTIAEKAIFLVTQKARTLRDQARSVWGYYTTENPVVSHDSEDSAKQQDRDRKEWVQKYKEVRVEHDDLMDLMRKRRLLETHLAETKDDHAEYNAAIDQELVRAKSAMEASLDKVLRGSGGRVRHFVPVRSASVSPGPSTNPTSLKNERELQVRAIRQKQEDPNAYSTEEEKQRDIQKMQQLKIEIHRDLIATITRKRVEVLRMSPVDNAKALRMQREIEFLHKSIAQAEGKKDSIKEETKTDAVTPDARTLAIPGVRKNSQLRVGKLSSRPLKRATIRASARANREKGSKLAVTSSSEEDHVGSIGTALNFKPTAPQQAPYPYFSANPQSLYRESTKRNSSNPASPGRSSRDSYGSFEDHMPLSQAIGQLSLNGSPEHVDPDVNRSFDSSFEDHSSFGLPLNTEDDYWTSEGSTESDVELSSIYSFDQFSELNPAPEPLKAMETASSTEIMSDSDQVEETDSDIQFAYKISSKDYRDAVIASRNTSAAFWTFRLYRNADGHPPKILYCTNYDLAEARAKEFLDEPVIGFDIEWETWAMPGKSTIKQNVSLIQIAAEDKVGLFHLAMFNGDTADKLLPPSLRTILESSKVTKAGVNISGDANRLKKCLDVDMRGLFELSHLYRVVELSESAPAQVNKRLVGLAEQVQKILGLPLKKDDVRTSAWSKRLQVEQTDYAASDAYAGFRLYHELEMKRKKMDPMPPRPAFWEEQQPLRLGDGRMIVSKPHPSKKKRDVSDDVTKPAEENDDECEEFFEAVESPEVDSSSRDTSQSSGKSDDSSIYMSPLEDSQDLINASQELSRSQQAPNTGDPSPSTRGPIRSEHSNSYQYLSPEVIRAENWVTNWRASLPAEYNLKVRTPTLRAYHMWHEQELDCQTVAALLRDPPLSVQTVASYVMTALKEEGLPYDVNRVREPLDILPKSVHGRYRRILERIG